MTSRHTLPGRELVRRRRAEDFYLGGLRFARLANARCGKNAFSSRELRFPLVRGLPLASRPIECRTSRAQRSGCAAGDARGVPARRHRGVGFFLGGGSSRPALEPCACTTGTDSAGTWCRSSWSAQLQAGLARAQGPEVDGGRAEPGSVVGSCPLASKCCRLPIPLPKTSPTPAGSPTATPRGHAIRPLCAPVRSSRHRPRRPPRSAPARRTSKAMVNGREPVQRKAPELLRHCRESPVWAIHKSPVPNRWPGARADPGSGSRSITAAELTWTRRYRPVHHQAPRHRHHVTGQPKSLAVAVMPAPRIEPVHFARALSAIQASLVLDGCHLAGREKLAARIDEDPVRTQDSDDSLIAARGPRGPTGTPTKLGVSSRKQGTLRPSGVTREAPEEASATQICAGPGEHVRRGARSPFVSTEAQPIGYVASLGAHCRCSSSGRRG